MSDPALYVQVAALAALRSDPGVALALANAGAASGVRVYEVPPVNAIPPYIVLQQGSTVPLLAEGMDLSEVELTPTVWTLDDPPSLKNCMAIGEAVLAALLGMTQIDGYRISQIRPVRSTYSLDHDGKTARVANAVRFDLDAL